MPIVTITINNRHFQLSCSDGEEERLQKAADKVAEKVEELGRASPRASTELLLAICALNLQDESTALHDKLMRTSYGQDEKVAETLTTIAGYLDQLATKMTR